MRIVIIGAGNVGYNLARRLSYEDIEVSVIESSLKQIRRIKETCDVFAIHGSGDSPEFLIEAGVNEADVVLAVTNQDAVNAMACYFSKTLAPECITLARARNQDYYKYDYFFNKAHLNIDQLINPELIAADSILKLISIPGACEVSEFLEGKVKLVGFYVGRENPIVGETLESLFRERTRKNLLIVAIKRGGKLIIPRGNSQIRVNDIIYFLTKGRGELRACDVLGYSKRRLTQVMIMGGGSYGKFIASKLETEGIDCKLIERNHDKCNELDQILKKTIVIHGDATDQELLHEENIEKMDAFIAVADDGPLNMLASVIAKKAGVKRTVALTNKKALYHLGQDIGIDISINPQLAVTNAILQFIRKGKIISVQTLADENAELLEFVAEESSSLVGVPMKDLELPKNALVGIIEHEGDIKIPTGADIIHPGDKVVIFATESAMKEVAKVIS